MTCFHVQQETQNSAKERQKSRRKEEMKDNSNQPPLNLTLVIPVGVWH